jgi:hypothetical protein
MVLLWFVLWFWSRDFFDADFPEGKEQVHIASSHLHAIFTPDGALVALGNVVTKVFHGVEDDFLFVGSFCYHAYTIPQNVEKARIFFAIMQFFFIIFLLDICKSFIFKHLRRAAGRAAVSR